jgi:hypothetical protein
MRNVAPPGTDTVVLFRLQKFSATAFGPDTHVEAITTPCGGAWMNPATASSWLCARHRECAEAQALAGPHAGPGDERIVLTAGQVGQRQ